MGGFATSPLACAVSRAGGLGLIGALTSPSLLDSQLAEASTLLAAEPAVVGGKNGRMALGVGLLLFALDDQKRKEMLGVLGRWRVGVVWLFGEREVSEFAGVIKEVREKVPGAQVWVQVCSVGAAVEVARGVNVPDVICLQGGDAGGHGWKGGAGVVSLVPEGRDAMREVEFKGGVVCAGGIVDARGVAAALALGADGVVMGTRFLASEEVKVPDEGYKRQVVEARDGGAVTVRDVVFDELKGPNIWPGRYDGRGLKSRSYEDHVRGMAIEEIRERHKKAEGEDGKGYGEGEGRRAVVWSGTGVGLVNEVKPAGEIVRSIREQVKARLEEARARL